MSAIADIQVLASSLIQPPAQAAQSLHAWGGFLLKAGRTGNHRRQHGSLWAQDLEV